MGRLRLDIINDEMVVTLQVPERVDNGTFGMVKKIKNVDTLDRETYEFGMFDGTEKPGDIVFVAHDGHRYADKTKGFEHSYDGKFYVELNDGFDVYVQAGELTRGYFLSRRDVISVEPHVLLADGEAEVGAYLQPKANSFYLEVAESKEKAIAVVDGKELWCGYPVYVIRFL